MIKGYTKFDNVQQGICEKGADHVDTLSGHLFKRVPAI